MPSVASTDSPTDVRFRPTAFVAVDGDFVRLALQAFCRRSADCVLEEARRLHDGRAAHHDERDEYEP